MSKEPVGSSVTSYCLIPWVKEENFQPVSGSRISLHYCIKVRFHSFEHSYFSTPMRLYIIYYAVKNFCNKKALYKSTGRMYRGSTWVWSFWFINKNQSNPQIFNAEIRTKILLSLCQLMGAFLQKSFENAFSQWRLLSDKIKMNTSPNQSLFNITTIIYLDKEKSKSKNSCLKIIFRKSKQPYNVYP